MCGIAGLLLSPGRSIPGAIDFITDQVAHRGPDARGIFFDQSSGIYLGHRRLAILDLSDAGAQPMTSRSGKYVIVFNGEIYNYRQLKVDLEASGYIAWRGTSDTEILLECFERWGVEETLCSIEGMFALALWDRAEGKLSLARDRFGEKPLYIGMVPGGLAFGSEMRTVMRCPGFRGIEDPEAIGAYLALTYFPEPSTIFSNVWKLPAGTFCSLEPGTQELSPKPYWSCVSAAMVSRKSSSYKESGEDIKYAIEERLTEVVEHQMVSDVPLGAFLSGGIDSSLVVALMQKSSSRPVRTFTVGFSEAGFNEAPYARVIADHLKTDHTEVIFRASDALALIDALPEIYDEPFSDISQLPTVLICRVAREDVTVCLSGDGGDEVFGGYNRHLAAKRLGSFQRWAPALLSSAAGQALRSMSQPRMSGILAQVLGPMTKMDQISVKMNKLAAALDGRDVFGVYLNLLRRDTGVMGSLQSRLPDLSAVVDSDLTLAEKFMLLDTAIYLPSDILVKVDRAAMSVGLETRVPYLDHKLYEMSWRASIDIRMRGGQTKSILRELLAKHVPLEHFSRPKAGFAVPLDMWFRGPLKSWLTGMLSRFRRDFPMYAANVQASEDKFFGGREHLEHYLWAVAVLQSWRERYSLPA